MRKAAIDHAWAECRARVRQRLIVDRVVLDRGGEDEALDVVSRVVAVIGTNGAGKTGFLGSIEAILKGDVSGLRPKLRRVEGWHNGQEFIALEGSGVSFDVSRTDVSEDVHRVMRYALHQEDFEELLVQTGGAELSPGDTEVYRYATGMNYDRITIYELERPVSSDDVGDYADADDAVVPFFAVQVDGYFYDSRAMGFGEQCACYLTWLAFRANKGSVLLLDEPDAHLSARIRRSILDVLAFAAHERKLWVCLSSHAMEPLEVLNEAEIYLIRSEGTGSVVSVASGKRQAMRNLGLVPYRRLLVVVEDMDALEAVGQIVSLRLPELSSSFDIHVVAGGASVINEFVRSFPRGATSCGVVGILDGDKREEFANVADLLFLPGDHDPLLLAKRVAEVEQAQLADVLGLDEVLLAAAIRASRHANHHDYCATVRGHYGFVGGEIATVRSGLIRLWLRSVEREAAILAEDLAARVRAL